MLKVKCMQFVSIIGMYCIYVTVKEMLSILQDKIKRNSRSGKLKCFYLHLQLPSCHAHYFISCCSVTVFILCHPHIFCFQLLSKTDSDDLMNMSSAKHQLSGNEQACILRYHVHTDFKRKLI